MDIERFNKCRKEKNPIIDAERMTQQEQATPSANGQNASKQDISSEKFQMFFRFGTIDNSLLVMSLLAGVSLDSFIVRRIGVKGFGPIMGGMSRCTTNN